MSAPSKPDDASKRTPRRQRRGHSAHDAAPSTPAGGTAAPSRPAKPRKIEPQLFRELDEILGAYVRQRLAPLVAPVAQGFFGAATDEERKDQELNTAMMLYFVYGWRDPQGVRIIDLFARNGVLPSPAHRGVLEAMLSTRYALCTVQQRDEARRQLHCVDFFTGSKASLADQQAWENLQVGDSLLAWQLPSGEVWRPIGVATHIPAEHRGGIELALNGLAEKLELPVIEFASREANRAFWLVYRLLNPKTVATS